MRLLELFSGTHSIGFIAKSRGFEITSLDRDLDGKSSIYDYESNNHLKEDILTWDYKQFPVGYFDIITASPVCLFWSNLRNTWIGRKCKSIHPTDIITKEHILNDIENKGVPMIKKTMEIIEYFNPKFFWIENPQTGKMKNYFDIEYPYIPYYDIDYCKYSDWGYKKRTRFWTNIENFKPKLCSNDCNNIIVNNKKKMHKYRMGCDKTIKNKDGELIRCFSKELRLKYKDYENVNLMRTNKYERYRIPTDLINELLDNCQ